MARLRLLGMGDEIGLGHLDLQALGREAGLA